MIIVIAIEVTSSGLAATEILRGSCCLEGVSLQWRLLLLVAEGCTSMYCRIKRWYEGIVRSQVSLSVLFVSRWGIWQWMGILEHGHNGNLAPTQTVPVLAPASAGHVCVTVLLLSVEVGCVKDQPWRLPTVPGTQSNFTFYHLWFKCFKLNQKLPFEISAAIHWSHSVHKTAYSNDHSKWDIRKYFSDFVGEKMSQMRNSDFKCCVPNNIVLSYF